MKERDRGSERELGLGQEGEVEVGEREDEPTQDHVGLAVRAKEGVGVA